MREGSERRGRAGERMSRNGGSVERGSTEEG